jgi:hypothetical protein
LFFGGVLGAAAGRKGADQTPLAAGRAENFIPEPSWAISGPSHLQQPFSPLHAQLASQEQSAPHPLAPEAQAHDGLAQQPPDALQSQLLSQAHDAPQPPASSLHLQGIL